MSLSRSIFLSLVAALAAGVSACTKPYSTPVVDEPPLVSAHRFPGIEAYHVPSKPLRIFWTHGMCTHDRPWVQNRSGLLATALDAEVVASRKSHSAAALKSYTVEKKFRSPKGDIDVTFFLWSPLTAPYKSNLAFDAPADDPDEIGGKFIFEQASLNKLLKNILMNDCLVDAVVYSGMNGNGIRTAMREAVCTALGGRMQPSDHCDLSAAEDDGPLLIVTESLGSKLLFDAVRSIWNAAALRPARAQAKLSEQLARMQMLYMLANQIPILDQAGSLSTGSAPADGAGDEAVSSLADFTDLLAQARNAAPRDPAASQTGGPFTIVAFTDPNDILSYRLLPEVLGLRDARLVNVIVSNSNTYFGIVERPDTAHCGYGNNPFVIGLLVHGYDPAVPLPKGRHTAEGACGN